MNQSNWAELEYIKWIKSIQLGSLFYASLIMMPIGVLFNLMSIIVFLRKRLRSTIMAYYNTLLAVCNILALFTLFTYYFTISIKSDITLLSQFMCKLVNYVLRICIHSVSWTQCAMIIDRMLVISFHNRFTFLKNKNIISIILVANLLVLMVANLSNFQLYINYENKTYQNQTRLATAACTSTLTILLIRDIISLMLRAILPFIIMLISNIILILSIIKLKKMQKYKKNQTIKNCKTPQCKESQLAFSIIAINIVFFITCSPIAVSLIVVDYYYYYSEYNEENFLNSEIILLCQYILAYFSTLNNILTFPLNLRYNKIFKAEFYQMLVDFKILKASAIRSKSFMRSKSLYGL